MHATARVLDISEHGRHLSLANGFVLIHEGDRELGRVPVEDVAAVMVSAYGTSITTPLVAGLAQHGAVVILCGRNHLPVAWMLPIVGHHAQTRIVAAQVNARRPLHKRLWQYVVQAKIRAQADLLAASGKESALLMGLIGLVRSDDSTNVEARAAQAYWPMLFGPGFRRDREADGVNTVLNYGYTVLRASTARAIVASGLHPSVSIRHRRDPLALADDLMEPFRPIVDACLLRMTPEGRKHVSRESREQLVEALGGRVELDVLRFVQSIANAYVTGRCPTWRRTGVASGAVRSADDHGRYSQGGHPVSAVASEVGLREDAVVGVCEEVSRAACHDGG